MASLKKMGAVLLGGIILVSFFVNFLMNFLWLYDILKNKVYSAGVNSGNQQTVAAIIQHVATTGSVELSTGQSKVVLVQQVAGQNSKENKK